MIPTPWQWQFPPIAEPPKYLWVQIDRVCDEAREADNAKFYGEEDERVAEELMDTIHAAETALRMMEADGIDLEAVKRYVIAKNDERGYYEVRP